MKKTQSFLAVGFGLVMLFFSCTACSVWMPHISLRARIEQIYGSGQSVEVFVEGTTGMALDGANVCLTGPDGAVSSLSFSAQSASYTAQLGPGLSGSYRISMVSAVYPEEMILNCQFSALSARPALTLLSDAAGASALSGQSLSAARTISLSWAALPEASAYLVTVYAAGAIVYSASTSGTECLIPSGSLSPGAHSLCIQAQALHGDPYLRDDDYSSICVADSPSYAFAVIGEAP